ncbi:MAG: DsbA family protein [Rhodobacter sp.]|nr:DsbA family protein [Rhodobacter sp.]
MPRLFTTAAALSAVLASPLAAFDMNAMSDAERDQFRAEIRAYLMDNPEVLLEAINVLEERQAADQAAGDTELLQVNAEDIFRDGYSFVGGNPDGDVTVVEFLDYRCGYCKRAHPEVAELLKTDGNIRYVVKELPILGDDSVLASRFAIAVKQIEGDDAYYQTHNTLMTMRAAISEQSLTSLSDQSGYDTTAVFAAMDSDATKSVIEANRALAQRLGINGTPSFVFESQMVRGYVPLDVMREAVAEIRADG